MEEQVLLSARKQCMKPSFGFSVSMCKQKDYKPPFKATGNKCLMLNIFKSANQTFNQLQT